MHGERQWKSIKCAHRVFKARGRGTAERGAPGKEEVEQLLGLAVGDAGVQPRVELRDVRLQRDAAQPAK